MPRQAALYRGLKLYRQLTDDHFFAFELPRAERCALGFAGPPGDFLFVAFPVDSGVPCDVEFRGPGTSFGFFTGVLWQALVCVFVREQCCSLVTSCSGVLGQTQVSSLEGLWSLAGSRLRFREAVLLFFPLKS